MNKKLWLFAPIIINFPGLLTGPPEKVFHLETILVSPQNPKQNGLNSQLYIPRDYNNAKDIYTTIRGINNRYNGGRRYSSGIYDHYYFYMLDNRVLKFSYNSYHYIITENWKFVKELHCCLVTVKLGKEKGFDVSEYQDRIDILLPQLESYSKMNSYYGPQFAQLYKQFIRIK